MPSNIESRVINSEKHIKQNPWLGASWKLLAFACYAALNGIARYLSGGADSALTTPLPVNSIIFFQDLFALLFVLPWILKDAKAWRKPRFKWLHVFRVIVSAIAVISWYFSIYFLPLADAVALSIIGPLLGVMGATLFLKERPSKITIVILFASFIAAFFLIQPYVAFSEHSQNIYGLVCVAISSIGFATAKVLTRKLASLGESRKLLTAYSLILIVPVTFVAALFVWVPPQLEHLGWLVGAGALTAVALYAVSSALAYAEVSFLAPFDCFRLILNASIGYLIFMELPQLWAIWLICGLLLIPISSLKFRNH